MKCMTRAAVQVAGLVAVSMGLAACAAILGLEDPALDDAGANDGAGGEASLDAGRDAADAKTPVDCGVPLGTADNCAACGHSCVGGSCTDGGCSVVPVTSGRTNPTALALDNGSVYIATLDSILRADKLTNDVAPLFAGSAGGAVRDVAADGTRVYWAAKFSAVQACPTADCDGGGVTLGPNGTHPIAVAVQADLVVWSAFDTAILSAANKNDGSNPHPLSSENMRAAALLADPSDVYVADTMSPRILKVPLDGSTFKTLATTNGPPSGLALVGDTVYFGVQGGALGVVPRNGGGAVLFGAPTKSAAGLATDGTFLYWADHGTLDGTGARKADGCIYRCALATCTTAPPTVVVCGQIGPKAVAVDGRAVYWTSLGPGTPTDFGTEGAVSKIGKPPP